MDYLRQAGTKAAARSALHDARVCFVQALDALELLPESRTNSEQAFEIRLELRPVLIQLGEYRQALERLREAEALAERLNDDHRRGRVGAFMTNIHSRLDEPDEALVSGRRALEIAGRLGDLSLRILATTYLAQAYYYRGEYTRVVELATDNLAALPLDWVYEFFGSSQPPSVNDRFRLLVSLAHLGRFAEAAVHEADAIRLAGPTRHAYTVGLAYHAAGTLHLVKGDWATAHALIERQIAVPGLGTSSGSFRLLSRTPPGPWRTSATRPRRSTGCGNASSSSRGSPRGEESGTVGPPIRWDAPVSCSAGWTRLGAWATARLIPHRVASISCPTRCSSSATLRPIPTASMRRAVRPITARRWPSASRVACAPHRPLPPRAWQALRAPGEARAGHRDARCGGADVPRHGRCLSGSSRRKLSCWRSEDGNDSVPLEPGGPVVAAGRG